MANKVFGIDFPAATLPLTGAELTSLNQSGTLKDATVQDIANLAIKTSVVALTPVAGVVTIDCALGDYFTLAPTANVTSIVFTNLPGSGKAATKMIRFTQDSTPRTVAWPASFKWSGAAPAVSTTGGAVDVLAITTFDNGTSWQATLAKAFV